ncbi:MAG: helix-turn-helix domain-containing protein [Phycisphaeraceae bacterium]|nr:helix-turn-helix domain-containing protein [Phycisphaeraceae bacterium]
MEPNRTEAAPIALTIAAAARRLAVSPMTVRRLLARGALLRIAVGRSVRVLARTVDELAERGGVTNAR